MSVMQYSETMKNSADVQIWNNAAFDNGESEDLSANRKSWNPVKAILMNPKESFDSVSSKENQGPLFENQNSSVSSSIKSLVTTPFKPLNSNVRPRTNLIKGIPKPGVEEIEDSRNGHEKEPRDVKKIDEEIEVIEMEISRLTSRLESLRMEKIERSVKPVEKRGRVVPAKFMEQKPSAKIAEDKKKIEEISSMSAKNKVQRRGLSLGPAEIVAGTRRGLSMCPLEIYGSAAKSRHLGKPETLTPVQPIQTRRKSCLWKLQEIDEGKVSKVRGSSLSVSPESRKVNPKKAQALPRQAVTTVGSKKSLKKEDGVINSIQPKKLFKDGEKSVPANIKKPLRPGRVVASRYNQSANQATAMRKRSLPGNDKDDAKRCDKKRSLSVGKSRVNSATEAKNMGSELRVKKRWEIPNEIVVHSSLEGEEKSPNSIVIVPELLPRIRIGKCKNETPRDSGPAKRVCELIGRKSFFGNDDAEVDDEPSVCQALDFAEEAAEEVF